MTSRLITLTGREEVETEAARAVKPRPCKGESRVPGELAELFQVELVGILRVHGLAFFKGDLQINRTQAHGLGSEADEVCFDPALPFVVDHFVPELAHIEIRAKLAVHSRQQVS